MREGFAPGVGRGVARPHKLYVLKLDPHLVGGSVEAAVFDDLAQERDYSLRTCTQTHNEITR